MADYYVIADCCSCGAWHLVNDRHYKSREKADWYLQRLERCGEAGTLACVVAVGRGETVRGVLARLSEPSTSR